MTRATNQSASSLTLGPAEAAPILLANLPPQVAVAPPPADNANAGLQANNQPATGQPASGPAPALILPPPAPSPAQNLTNQLLSLDPTMTVSQLTGILNILAPNRHMRNVASNLLRSSLPRQQPRPPPPAIVLDPIGPVIQPPAAVASAPNPAPQVNPLTGPRITNPQRRAQPQSHRTSVQDILQSLDTPSRKRSEGLPGHISGQPNIRNI